MDAVFVELPSFEKLRGHYLSDEAFSSLQKALLANPIAGDIVAGTGGLRKLRHGDERRQKGRRGGIRVLYFWFERGREFWLFTLYDKDERVDLSVAQKATLKEHVEEEVRFRESHCLSVKPTRRLQ